MVHLSDAILSFVISSVLDEVSDVDLAGNAWARGAVRLDLLAIFQPAHGFNVSVSLTSVPFCVFV